MRQDYKDFLSAFQSHGVKYLVIGGFAVSYQSQPRFAKDIDIFIGETIPCAVSPIFRDLGFVEGVLVWMSRPLGLEMGVSSY
jgi:hypothetical protein